MEFDQCSLITVNLGTFNGNAEAKILYPPGKCSRNVKSEIATATVSVGVNLRSKLDSEGNN